MWHWWDSFKEIVDASWRSFLFLKTSSNTLDFEVERQMKFVKHTHWLHVFALGMSQFNRSIWKYFEYIS